MVIEEINAATRIDKVVEALGRQTISLKCDSVEEEAEKYGELLSDYVLSEHCGVTQLTTRLGSVFFGRVPLLLWAIAEGFSGAVPAILQKSDDILGRDTLAEQCFFALKMVLEADCLDIFKTILQHDACPKDILCMQDVSGNNLLMMAVILRKPQFFRELLADKLWQAGVVYQQNSDNKTVLDLAVFRNDSPSALVFLNKAIERDDNLSLARVVFNALCLALERHSTDVMTQLLASSACPSNILSLQDGDGNNLLMLALKSSCHLGPIIISRSRYFDDKVLLQKNEEGVDALTYCGKQQSIDAAIALLKSTQCSLDVLHAYKAPAQEDAFDTVSALVTMATQARFGCRFSPPSAESFATHTEALVKQFEKSREPFLRRKVLNHTRRQRQKSAGRRMEAKQEYGVSHPIRYEDLEAIICVHWSAQSLSSGQVKPCADGIASASSPVFSSWVPPRDEVLQQGHRRNLSM